MKLTMTPMQRVTTALKHQEADRVPFFLTLTMHPAKMLGMSIQAYFSNVDAVVEGQIQIQKRYGHDCLIGATYAAIEFQAWGGDVIFYEDGPPNTGEPLIRIGEDLNHLHPPKIEEQPCLANALQMIRQLKRYAGDQIPIVGVALSPFSFPVMQLGFSQYLRLLYEDRARFWQLMELNEDYFLRWVQAQFEAGISALTYYDPLSSPGIIPRGLFLETGFKVAQRMLPKIPGLKVFHFASGHCMPVLDDLLDLPINGVAPGVTEDIQAIKSVVEKKMVVLGNLNGIEMRRWKPEDARRECRQLIRSVARGGGFILMDNHGEIPWDVSDGVLSAISETVQKEGRYPIAD